MQDAPSSAALRNKYAALLDDLDERGRRRWAATEARALGRGGFTAVATATGLSDRTIRTGLAELDDPAPLPGHRQRKAGAGRKPHATTQPGLQAALDRLIGPATRGSPTNPLRWTIKSTHRLAEELRTQGCAVSATSVRRMLATMKYSLQSNRKTREGAQHPDRDGQFEHIAARVTARQRRSEPAISVDTKTKEVLGNLKNPGKTLRPQNDPTPVKTTASPIRCWARRCRTGCTTSTTMRRGSRWGISHDTAEFAVAAIRRWWTQLGRARYPRAKRIVVTADRGGSNSSRCRLWKLELQQWADETGLIVEVCHYPPGTSKWNKVEHRLFCHITRNWQGRPLESLEVVVESIAATTTASGLEVHAWLDEGTYANGRKVSDAELEACDLRRNKYHGEWNCEIHPRAK